MTRQTGESLRVPHPGDDELDLVAMGAYVRARRRELRLTQRALGDMLGWTQERVCVVERGKYGMPSLPQLVRLAGALDVQLSALLIRLGIIESHAELPDGESPAHSSCLLNRIQTLSQGVQDVNTRLHRAEAELIHAESLRLELQSRREHMAVLLERCRE